MLGWARLEQGWTMCGLLRSSDAPRKQSTRTQSPITYPHCSPRCSPGCDPAHCALPHRDTSMLGGSLQGFLLNSLPLPQCESRDSAKPCCTWRMQRCVPVLGSPSWLQTGWRHYEAGGGTGPHTACPSHAHLSCRSWPPWTPTPRQSALSSSTNLSK